VPDLFLDARDDLAGIGLIPAPVQVLGRKPKLDDQVAGQVLRLDFPSLFPPEPDQRAFVITHDDAGVRGTRLHHEWLPKIRDFLGVSVVTAPKFSLKITCRESDSNHTIAS
jgi:hypothetical protein